MFKVLVKAYRGTREAGEWREVMMIRQARHAGGVQHLSGISNLEYERDSGKFVAFQNDL